MTVVFRIFDDAVGFRYELPAGPGFTHANIADELTEFNVAESGTAWWDEALEWNREEYLYRRTPIEEIGTAQTPLTIRTDSGLHLSIHEAALVDYSGMDLRRIHDGLLKADLMPSSTGPKVSRDLPLATPWRVIMIAPDAPALYKSAQIDPQPQRAQQARRRQLGQADEICRHLVGHAPRPGDLELRAQAWRDDRQRQEDDRFRRGQRLQGAC